MCMPRSNWPGCERAHPTVGGTILRWVESSCVRKLPEHEPSTELASSVPTQVLLERT